jgi:hypothetical protein
MLQIHKIFRHLAAGLALCACFASPAAEARGSAEIAAVFNAGVAAYDAGDYEKAFQLWWDLRFEDIAAMRNLGMMLRKGQGTAARSGACLAAAASRRRGQSPGGAIPVGSIL